MQIDVLSQNTLKLTLSRLDMFDLDIRYESLSGKNPDTKRLLSRVLRTVKSDKNNGVDFSGERLFVEAFPRPDGGCMLYISCLLNEKDETPFPVVKKSKTSEPLIKKKNEKSKLLCKFTSANALGGVCRNLSWQLSQGKLSSSGLGLESVLYNKNGEYRLLLRSGVPELISAIGSEYGEVLNADEELPFTNEHYNILVPENAVQKMSELF